MARALAIFVPVAPQRRRNIRTVGFEQITLRCRASWRDRPKRLGDKPGLFLSENCNFTAPSNPDPAGEHGAK